jgi:hypothetical protein
MTFFVNNRQCSTCIFGPHSPIGNARFEELKKGWTEGNCVQQCHQSNIAGGNVACRGHYEAARRSEIPHPINGVFGAHLDIEQSMRVAEALGFVQFVSVHKPIIDEGPLPFENGPDEPRWDEEA